MQGRLEQKTATEWDSYATGQEESRTSVLRLKNQGRPSSVSARPAERLRDPQRLEQTGNIHVPFQGFSREQVSVL